MLFVKQVASNLPCSASTEGMMELAKVEALHVLMTELSSSAWCGGVESWSSLLKPGNAAVCLVSAEGSKVGAVWIYFCRIQESCSDQC